MQEQGLKVEQGVAAADRRVQALHDQVREDMAEDKLCKHSSNRVLRSSGARMLRKSEQLN